MMRVFWEEWREGRRFSLRRGLPVGALVLAGGLAAFGLQPGVFFEVMAGCLIVLGLWSGTQRWNRIGSWGWMAEGGVKPAAYLAGKVGGFLLLTGYWMVFVSPVLLLLVFLWDIPWNRVVVCLGWALAAGSAAQALGHLGSWGPSTVFRFVGSGLVAAWMLAFSFPPLVRLHPLWQIFRLHAAADSDPDPLAWVVLMAAVLVVWTAVGAFHRWGRPR